MAKLQLDVRESKLAAVLQEQGTPFESTPLIVGDIQIVYDGKPLFVWERKTTADLICSIKDSRYKEQKERLLRAFPRGSIMYIVEGQWDYSAEMVKGAVINTMLRDDIKVFVVPSVKSTACFIADVMSRINRDPGKYASVDFSAGAASGGGDYVDALAAPSKKRDMMDAYTFSVMTLSLIPGVSKTTAKAVVDAYGNVSALCAKGTLEPATLAALKLPSGRCLGPKLAARILAFIQA